MPTSAVPGPEPESFCLSPSTVFSLRATQVRAARAPSVWPRALVVVAAICAILLVVVGLTAPAHAATLTPAPTNLTVQGIASPVISTRSRARSSAGSRRPSTGPPSPRPWSTSRPTRSSCRRPPISRRGLGRRLGQRQGRLGLVAERRLRGSRAEHLRPLLVQRPHLGRHRRGVELGSPVDLRDGPGKELGDATPIWSQTPTTAWTNYTIAGTFTITSNAATVLFRGADTVDYYLWQFRGPRTRSPPR